MVTITVKSSNADKLTIDFENFQITTLNLKELISAQLQGVSAAQQRLIYKGKILQDNAMLETYGINDQDTVHLVKVGVTSIAGASSASTATATSAPAPPAVQSNINASPWGAPAATAHSPFGSSSNAANMQNLMQQMGGMGGMGGNMQQMQQQLMNDPAMMQQLMNSPMMENLMSNPDMIQQMMASDPNLQRMLDANPQMRHVMSDPAILRQSMEMMRNPRAMQEAMRSQDLAMSQIENMPGGFNALRRMYEDVQVPLMEAGLPSTSSGAAANSLPAQPARSTPQNTALPNPWGGGSPAAQTAPSPFGAGSAMPGFGGAGMPNMQQMMQNMGGMGMGGSAPDISQLSAMMQNPMMQQMLQQTLSNPAALEAMAASNPQLRTALQNPQMRAILSNPQMMQQLMNPQTLSAMAHMQSVFGGTGGPARAPGMGGFGLPAAPQPPAPGGFNGLDFSQFLGGRGGAAAPSPFASAAHTPASMSSMSDPAATFASQNQQLQDMGFGDQAANLRALVATQGNVNAAVERLLG